MPLKAMKAVVVLLLIVLSTVLLVPAISASSKRADEFQAQQNLYVAYKTSRDAKKANGGKFPDVLALSQIIQRQTPQFGQVETKATEATNMKEGKLYIQTQDADVVFRIRAKSKVCTLLARSKGDSKLESCSDSQSVFGRESISKDRFVKMPDNYASWLARGFVLDQGIQAEANIIMLRTDLISRSRSMIKVEIPETFDAPTMVGPVLGAKDHRALVGFYSANRQLSIGIVNALGQIEYVLASKRFVAKPGGTYWLALDWAAKPRLEIYDFDPETTGIAPADVLEAATELDRDGLPGFLVANGLGTPKVLEASYR